MKQFDLSLWLQDKSRKICTRDGNEAEIIHDKYPLVAIINGVAYNFDNDGKFQSNKSEHGYDLFFADEEEELTEFERELEMMMVSFSNGNLGSDVIKEMPKPKLHDYAHRLLDLARKEIEKENSEFKPKFTYNEKDYSKLANKLIEFRNNTPLCSVSYRDGEGRKVILHYEKEIFDLVRNEIEKDIYDNGYRIGYETGKEETLQSMPRWKKVISGLTRKELFDMMYKYIVTPFEGYKDYYYLDKADLEKLPKEE